MRFHILSLPHTQTTKEYTLCAYTMKVIKLCTMLKSLGHEVFLYGGSENEAPCDEFISCISKEQLICLFPDNNWKKDFFAIEWNSRLPYWLLMNANITHELSKRINPKDFICLTMGNSQKVVADAFPANIAVETGIGYTGVCTKFKIFESYAWQHYVYGLMKQEDGLFYDTVIPNSYDPNDFVFSDKKDNYFLYIGRIIQRKGVQIASEVCKKLNARLIVAGQGMIANKNNIITSKEISINGEYIGTVNTKERAELMSKARAVFCPTQYIGPFEGVSVEAMMCGTPVITTDFGCFTETIKDGLTGYRCRTFGEFLWAAKNADTLNYKNIRDYAISHFSLNTIRWRYHDYFVQLYDLWGKGWYSEDYDPKYKRDLGGFL